jgi:hypothetical protein
MTAHLSLDRLNRGMMDLLTRRVRLATEDQLRAYAKSQFQVDSSLTRRLCRLEKVGLLVRQRAMVGMIPFVSPLHVSKPEHGEPEYDKLAWRLQWRWAHATSESYTLFWASPRAVQLFGGASGWLRQPLQFEHDLAVTAVFLRRMQTCPAQMAGWMGEDGLRQRSAEWRLHSIPDAVILNSEGAIQTVVELGGIYPAEKLRRFHRHFRMLSYELW